MLTVAGPEPLGHEGLDRPAGQLTDRVVEQVGRQLVGEDDVAVRADDEDGIGQQGKERFQQQGGLPVLRAG